MPLQKVGKLLIAYCAGAWLLLQLADVLVPALKLPDWVTTVLAVAVIVVGPAAFLGTAAWHMFAADRASKRNRIFDVEVEEKGENKLRIIAWYYYDGILGPDGVSITIAPFNRKARLAGGAQWTGGAVTVIGHEAMAQIDYAYKPKLDVELSTHLMLCLEHVPKGSIYCRRITYKKRWRKPDRHSITTSKEPDEPRAVFENVPSTVLFGWRLNEVFAGVRKLAVYDGEEALDRLEELLHPPLAGKDPRGVEREPFWWFRGGRSSNISDFRRISQSDFILDRMEFRMRSLAVWRDDDERREFVYIETEGLEPTGLYPEKPVSADEDFGYEPYAVLGEHLIPHEEYVDGHTRLDGKIINLNSAEPRMRFLVPYNFIITGKSSPLNSTEFDRASRLILEGILRGTHEVMDLVDASKDLPAHRMHDDVW